MKMQRISAFILAIAMSGILPVGVALAHTIDTASTVSLSASPVTEGTSITVTGNVDPWGTVASDHKDGKIQIQRWDGASWINLNGSGSTPDADGNVAVVFDTIGLGGTTVNFRSHFVTGGGSHKLATSDSGEVTLAIDEPEPNSAPVLTVATDPVVVDEGETALNSGTYSDADADAVTLTASVGGITDNGDGTWNWSFATTDDSDSQTVTICANDGVNDPTCKEFTLTVSDVPPTISSVTNDGPIIVGGGTLITVTASAGPFDVLSYEFDCDNDGLYEVGPQSGNTTSCTFTSVGTHTVKVRVTDDDGSEVTGTTDVSVVYDFGGFLAPLGPGPRAFKAGSTIPVKFTLMDATGDPVSTAVGTASLNTSPESSAVCRYDATDMQYVCNLKTPKSAAPGSYTITVTMDDNTPHTKEITIK